MNAGGKMMAFAASLLILTGCLAYLSTRGPNDPILFPYLPTGQYLPVVRIGDASVRVFIANTEAQRTQGLSGRDMLQPKQGMFFIFEEEGNYGIWMKDMKFAIDIIWVNNDGRIVGIEKHATPESYPKVFMPSEPARYVIEVAAGFVEQYNVTAQDEVNFGDIKH